ncbi:hypothetical protein L1987_12718 [Smallanthus sonchifolius]|uniref:Uncharacterized protein n=1 Tax=Smallanthus sonchifolius TaxID=185202 RepID=A0ACB9JFH9_9ASTR|nr:hypothetical protein L1987_12718 [Smallanthus sonchifolius]
MAPAATYFTFTFLDKVPTHTTTVGKSSSNWHTDNKVNALYESWLVKHAKTCNALGDKDRSTAAVIVFQVFVVFQANDDDDDDEG